MKRIIFVIGILVTAASVISIFPHIAEYENLTEYGSGYIVGKILLAVLGISLIVIGKRKSVHSNA